MKTVGDSIGGRTIGESTSLVLADVLISTYADYEAETKGQGPALKLTPYAK